MDRTSEKSTDWLDGAAVALSAMCLVHCLLLPLLVAGLPLFAQFSGDHLHLQMLIVVIPLSIVALGIGFRRHRSRRVVLAGAVGLVILTLGATVAHSELGLVADRIMTVSGAVILAAAHYYNSVLARRCRAVSAIG